MSYTGSDQVVESLIGILTALSSVITTAAGGAVTLSAIGTALSNYATNDLGLTNQTAGLITALSSSCAATSPSSHIRNSVWGA